MALNFYQLSQILEMFVQPKDVPEPITWAVYRIMHNQATADDWEALDAQIADTSLERVLKHIGDVLVANPGTDVEPLESNLQWFKKELTRSGGQEN